jgi:hypothetical protein
MNFSRHAGEPRIWGTERVGPERPMMEWGIPSLRAVRLATEIPTRTFAGGLVTDPTTTLFLWRTGTFPQTARGGVLGFFVDDYRFECLWRQPTRYAEQFVTAGWGAIIEPDFSVWADRPLVEQLFNVYRMRTLGRLYQEHGLWLIPNVTWSTEPSFPFVFTGIPYQAPVVACECRTAGQRDDDRRAFLRGLQEAVRQLQPQHVLLYGGVEHSFWLTGHLPTGPEYTLLESWTTARGRVRAAQERQLQDQNQFSLFGGDSWVDAEQ